MGVATNSVCPENSSLTYEDFAKPFFERYCLECHSEKLQGSARHGAPSDHDFDTLDDVFASNLAHIDLVAAAGPDAINTDMPRGTRTPTEAERRRLGEWLACGAP